MLLLIGGCHKFGGIFYQKIYDEKIDLKKIKFLTEKNPFQIKEPISLKEEWDVPLR